jgi:hypothetical protein
LKEQLDETIAKPEEENNVPNKESCRKDLLCLSLQHLPLLKSQWLNNNKTHLLVPVRARTVQEG